jgi:3-deoxy-D-manno-octulosonate 8-phosphate phosphatase (KDO 8-P phosphatase)
VSGLPAQLGAKLARIRVLAVDVDGVLTDGALYYGADGEALKRFHVRDGLGLRMLMDNGVEVAVISARTSPPLTRRLAELGITHVFSGRSDKRAALAELIAELGVGADEVAFVGDDLLDLPVFAEVGLAISVADGHALVREAAEWTTSAAGGNGAVREIADAILASKVGLRQACAKLLGDDQ